MPDTQSPFEIVTPSKPKKMGSKGLIVAFVVVLFLALGIFAGVILVKQRQEIREKAAGNKCPAAEACPVPQQKTLLRNCTPQEADGSPEESLCNRAGRVQSCGGEEFCCPAAGKAWTKDLTQCQSSSPTASATATATATSTASPGATKTASPTPTKTSTASASATKTPTPTNPPIPETGTGWPTYVGAGLGILVIIGSFLLAF